jgi:hypothetical protein
MNYKGIYIVKCTDKYGNLKWEEEAPNVVTSTGIHHIMEAGLTTHSTEVGDWYIGLMNTSATNIAIAHTMGSHTGWAECTLYAESTRPEWSKTLAAQTCGNTAAKATFTLNTDGTTIGGAFISSSLTAGGSSGILLSGAAFGSKKTGDSGDKLEVSYKIVGSDDTSS